MSERRSGALVGLGWGEIRALAPERASGGGKHATLGACELHRTSAAWWPRGAVHELAVREGAEAWLHVVAGELAIERWAQDDEGAWHASSARVASGSSRLLDGGAVHRVLARRAASVMVVCTPPDAISDGHDRATIALLRGARAALETDAPSATAIGLPAPTSEIADDGDA